MTDLRPSRTRPWRTHLAVALWTLAGLGAWAYLWVLGQLALDGFALDLGSTEDWAPRYGYFCKIFFVFGGLGCLMLARAMSILAPRRLHDAAYATPVGSRHVFVWLAMTVALLIAVSARVFILENVPLTDDESAYLFAARTLLMGGVSVPSHEAALFFDRAFMVNDGMMYTQYFLGWPAVLAVGERLGIAGFTNAVLFALTIPLLYGVLRQNAPESWSRIGVILYCLSPLLVFNGATMMSHSSCVFMLASAHYVLVRHQPERSPLAAALFAALLCAAFFIRPLTALGIGAPLGVVWLWHSGRSGRPLRVVTPFVVVALVFAALFLGANAAQNGDPLKPAYRAYSEFEFLNDFRFALRTKRPFIDDMTSMKFDNPAMFLEHVSWGLKRLNFALFGWPSSFVFAVLALVFALRRALLPASMFLGFVLLHMPVTDAGIDSFGPVHYTELAWPVLLLTVLGLRSGEAFLSRKVRSLSGFLVALLMTSVVAAFLFYLPPRHRALRQIVDDIQTPYEAVEEQTRPGRKVIFSPMVFSAHCGLLGARVAKHFVYWRPNNRPDLSDDVLWVNHLDVPNDQKLMKYFPDREGYILWHGGQCRMFVTPVMKATPDKIPAGLMRYRWTDDGQLMADRYDGSPISRKP